MKSALANVKSAPPRWRTRISRWKQLKMNKISKRISKDFRWIKSCDYRWSMRTTTGNLFARKSNSRSFFEHPTWVLIKLLCIPSKRWDLAFFLVLYKSYNKNITEHRNEYLLYFQNQLKINWKSITLSRSRDWTASNHLKESANWENFNRETWCHRTLLYSLMPQRTLRHGQKTGIRNQDSNAKIIYCIEFSV